MYAGNSLYWARRVHEFVLHVVGHTQYVMGVGVAEFRCGNPGVYVGASV